jgi:hypothetical protein
VDELDTIRPRRERLAGASQRIQVAIETDDPGRTGFEQRARVAAQPDRAVDE